MRIACPYCGERDASEFTYRGDAAPIRPDATPSGDDAAGAVAQRDQFHDYVYLRKNIAGFMREHWYHGAGCRSWLVIERNTLTHEIRSIESVAPTATRKAATKRGGRR